MVSACAVLYAHAAGAAAPVVDSAAATEVAPVVGLCRSGLPAPAAVEDGGLSGLFYQMQLLRQEVQALRGLVEEQDYKISRLTRETQAQYMDLDRRLAEQYRGQPAPGGGTPAPASAPAGGPAVAGARAPAAGSGSEREAYSAAFALLQQKTVRRIADRVRRVDCRLSQRQVHTQRVSTGRANCTWSATRSKPPASRLRRL